MEWQVLRIADDCLRAPAEALGSQLDHVRGQVDAHEGAAWDLVEDDSGKRAGTAS